MSIPQHAITRVREKTNAREQLKTEKQRQQANRKQELKALKNELTILGGRPRSHTKIEWEAVRDGYIPYKLGYRRLEHAFNNEPYNKSYLIQTLKEKGWSRDKLITLIARIENGYSKMSHQQAMYLYRTKHYNQAF